MNQKAFTLIELLIVVAIIGILAAIALPNFLNAQMRAKIARVNAEVNSLRNALESYRIDNNVYPMDGNDFPEVNIERFNQKNLHKCLTSPVSYLSNILMDPFHPNEVVEGDFLFDTPPHPYLYFTISGYGSHRGNAREYSIFSYGPDQDFDNGSANKETAIRFNASNGLKSNGDILFYGP